MSQIGAVDVQKIKDVIDELGLSSLAKHILKRLEIGDAVVFEGDYLAIEYGLLHRQLGCGIRQVPKIFGPALMVAAIKLYPPIVDAADHAVTVELYFVKPVISRRRVLHQRCQFDID